MPRLGSISRREKQDSTAVAPSAGRQTQRHRASADVIGDVALELVGRQSQVAILRRQRVRGMVAQQISGLLPPATNSLE